MERFQGIKQHLATYSDSSEQTVFTDAHGAYFVDENGREHLCLNDISCILGYQHPQFTSGTAELVKTQLLCHAGMLSEPKEKMIRNFMDVTHGDFDKILIASSGGETVDWALKIARRFTGKDGIISFRNALHGRSFAGAYISEAANRKEGFGSGREHIRFWDYPSDGRSTEPAAADCTDIAAIIIEPYQALSGMDSPSTEYWKWLRAYTKEQGIVLILDEIQTGFGKTGSFFAYEESGIVPDILLAGKGMSNGFGLGALLMTKEISTCVNAANLSGGSADNNLMCSIVNLVFNIIRDENIIDHVKATGKMFAEELLQIIHSKGIPGSIHGKGLYFSLELPEGMSERICREAKENRILLGRAGNRIVVRSPLVLTEKDVLVYCDFLRTVI